MKPIYRFSTIALLALGSFAWWYYQTPRILERKLDTLIATLNLDPTTTRASRLMKSSSIEKYFDEQVELTSPIDDINGNFSSAEINSGYSFLSENAREINLQRVGEITCEVDEKHATQQFQVNAKITVSRWFKNLDGRQAVTVHWRKTQQGWRIHSSDWKEIP